MWPSTSATQQIVFVNKVIDYVVKNGYMEDVKPLTQPPFDKPVSSVKLFDAGRQKQLVELLGAIWDNAVHVAA
jgi:type I restriction enzyme R subunit